MKVILTIFLFFNLSIAYCTVDSSLIKDALIKTSKDSIRTKVSISSPVQIPTKDTLLVKGISDKTISNWDWVVRWGAVLGLIGGLLGLVITFVTIREKLFLNPKVTSTIISYYTSFIEDIQLKDHEGKQKQLGPAMKYLIKFSLNIRDADLNYKVVDILVKFKEDEVIYLASKSSPLILDPWLIEKHPHTLNLTPEELLNYQTNLEKNKTHQLFATFFIANNSISENNLLKENYKYPESIQLKFYSIGNSLWRKNVTSTTNKMTIVDINAYEYLYEKNIWTLIDSADKSASA